MEENYYVPHMFYNIIQYFQQIYVIFIISYKGFVEIKVNFNWFTKAVSAEWFPDRMDVNVESENQQCLCFQQRCDGSQCRHMRA